jgi:hypothetical protein
MVAADEILKAADFEPIFTPVIGKALKSIFPDSASKIENKLLNSNISQVTNNNIEIKANELLLDRFKELNLSGDLTVEELSELQKLILENLDQLKTKNKDIKQDILDLLDKNK